MIMSWDYVAGFTDGEGSIGFVRGGRNGMYTPPRITWGQKDRATLEAVKDFLVVEGFHPNFYYIPPNAKANRPNGIYMMNLQRRDEIKRFCEEIQPRVILKFAACTNVLQWLEAHPRRFHTAELESVLLAEYVEEGFTQAQIAKFLGCSDQKVRKVGKRLGIVFPQGGGKIENGKHVAAMTRAEYLRHRREKEKNNQCLDCGKFIYKDSTRCTSCAVKLRHQTQPESFKASSIKSVLAATSPLGVQESL